MQEEREELVKKVFPRLRKICERRRVAWSEVDLRWGITDEQKAEGAVLPLCIAEIEHCRPYFIGILGERYGWVAEDMPKNVIDEHGWLMEYEGRSITDLEMVYGALRDPEIARNAFFYFRDPAYIETIPRERRGDYIEASTPEDLRRYGLVEAERRSEERTRKLKLLKNEIVAKGFPVQVYPDPSALGELVFDDMKKMIDRFYPEEEQLDPLDLDALEHESFAEARFGAYVGRSEYFDALDRHAEGNGPLLVITGEAGAGKSALLANWHRRYSGMIEGMPENKAPILLLMHFIGATPASADLSSMLRRIMGELKRSFGISMDIPDKPEELKPAFSKMLQATEQKGRAILILDACNQLDGGGTVDLSWLPRYIPSNIRLVLSILPGKETEELFDRGYSILNIEPLDVDERKKLIGNYLSTYGKRLDKASTERIAAAALASNPLFLRSVLEEIRLYGDWNTLSDRIDYYISSHTIEQLHEKILRRYEQDYGSELVKYAMSSIWAARKGLYETELLDLLGKNGDRLPMAFLSPLLLAAEHSMISRSGLLCFSHDYMKKAVKERYLPDDISVTRIHLWLANYFDGHELSVRKIDELPWHLAEAGSWDALARVLVDEEFFEAAWRTNMYDIKMYWALIEKNSPIRMVDAFRPVIETPSKYADGILFDTSNLLAGMVNYPESLSIGKYVSARFREKNNLDMLQQTLGNMAAIYSMQSKFEAAMEAFREKEKICRDLNDKAGVISALNGLADIFQKKGDFREAYGILKEQSNISREIGDKTCLKNSLIFQAVTHTNMYDHDAALPLWKESEELCRELGDKDDLARTLNGQSTILQSKGDLDGAIALIKQSEKIGLELGNKIILGRAYYSLGNVLRLKGDLEGALEYYKKHGSLAREIGIKYAIAGNLCAQASIYRQMGKPDDAMELLKESEKISREAGLMNELQFSLGEQGLIFFEKGDLDRAMVFFKEEERIFREQNVCAGVADSLEKQAMILRRKGDLDGVLALLNEVELIYRNNNLIKKLQVCLESQSTVLRERGDIKMLSAVEKELATLNKV